MFKIQGYQKQAVYYNITVLPLTILFFHTSQKNVAHKYGLIRQKKYSLLYNDLGESRRESAVSEDK